MEAELPYDEVDGRRVTEEATVAGPKRMEVSTKEEVNQFQGSMGIEEVPAVKDVHWSEMEEDFVICEHTEEFGGEQIRRREEEQ